MSLSEKNGFTLPELVIVLTVFAIVGSWAVYSLIREHRTARDLARISAMYTIQNGLERYFTRYQEYPEGEGIALGARARFADCAGSPCGSLSDAGWSGRGQGTAYIAQIPLDPADPLHACSPDGADTPCLYTYWRTAPDAYQVYFYLEGELPGLPGGLCVLEKQGVRCLGEGK